MKILVVNRLTTPLFFKVVSIGILLLADFVYYDRYLSHCDSIIKMSWKIAQREEEHISESWNKNFCEMYSTSLCNC